MGDLDRVDRDHWSKITRIMVHQRNRWIHSGHGEKGKKKVYGNQVLNLIFYFIFIVILFWRPYCLWSSDFEFWFSLMRRECCSALRCCSETNLVWWENKLFRRANFTFAYRESTCDRTLPSYRKKTRLMKVNRDSEARPSKYSSLPLFSMTLLTCSVFTVSVFQGCPIKYPASIFVSWRWTKETQVLNWIILVYWSPMREIVWMLPWHASTEL